MIAAAGLWGLWEVEAGASLAYDDNVFNLSDRDLTRFDNGEDYFYWMETSDDFLTNAWLRGRLRAQVGQWDISPFVKGGYDYFASNTDKSCPSMLTGVEADWNKLSLNLYYGYYPEVWVRHYHDKDGASGDPVKFSYDKNLYKLDAGYRLFRKDWVYLYGRFEQYFHNEHFTEYDADAVTFGVGWRHSFQTFYLTARYFYCDYTCDDAPATGAVSEDDFSDASYESDTVEIVFRNKKVEFLRGRYLRPFIDFEYEKRAYQTDNVDDTFHAGREDSRYNVTFGATFYLWPSIELTAEYDHNYRKATSSENDDIGKYKDYIANQFSIGIDYTFSL